ncbi:hypothetical protein VMT65_31685 [Nocardia sp. CDC153]|uniref:hypothetical protein n=1 Tax=Nocardia sp. CDC153 TaxID=3112167 RepID=UPI002DBF36F4|nr:hypothetical protein [Nocardia sp. CDC153]MEC3957633.1 hypothetical protein [Nocardia sp. CDC153]
MTVAATGPVFSHLHILLTAAITAALTTGFAVWRLGRDAWIDVLGTGLATGAAVYLWRTSANMPQLNDDGLPHFSANDWLAPVLVYLFISLYATLRPPADRQRFEQTRALAVLTALAVNVITI